MKGSHLGWRLAWGLQPTGAPQIFFCHTGRKLGSHWKRPRKGQKSQIALGYKNSSDIRSQKSLLKFILKPDLHSIIFTVQAVLKVQMDEPDGDGMTFLGTPAPV